MTKLRTSARNKQGATVVLVAIVAFFILLPLGLFSFEVARLYLAQIQLQNAVDAAALSAMLGLSNPGKVAQSDSGTSEADLDRAVEDFSLMQYRRNSITSSPLEGATISATVATDKPAAGASTYHLAIDHSKGQVRAEAAFGLETSFGHALGLGPVTIRAHSLAGSKFLQGDIVICLDMSDSIKAGCGINGQSDGSTSKSWNVHRHTNIKGMVPKYSYLSVTKANPVKGQPPVTIQKTPRSGNSPAGLHVGGNYLHSIPNPAQVFSKPELPPLLRPFAHESSEVQTAVLVEAKEGHLNSRAAYDRAKVSDTILGDEKYFGSASKPGALQPGNGDYRAAYQEVALPFVHPLADEKRDVSKLINYIVSKNPDANIALVGFCPKAGGHLVKVGHGLPKELGEEQGVVDGSGKYGYGVSCLGGKNGFKIPFIRFAKGNSKLVKDSVDVGTTASGTNIPDALNVAHALLTEDGRNLKGVPQICFLLTDGIPTVGGSVRAAKKFGKDGIPIVVIGYSNTGYAGGRGPKVCLRIADAGGGGSKYIPAPYNEQPGGNRFKGFYDAGEKSDKALDIAFSGTPVLLND
ncbi:MAG: hypothetical protein K2X27_13865 [Candidatus Obscuribacterales bacterium]|nr:hypothetical protein [Candidatus Obscuribacterales bacterium]